MDRVVFFDTVRGNLFNGKLSQLQVNGMDAILNEWEQRGLVDTRWLAYMLATTFHETAFTMQPIEEYGQGRGRAYGEPDPETGQVYFGRGFVQLTWRDNYLRFSERLGLDLLAQPELALELPIASQILFDGMVDGLFTGVGLSRYFREDSDWYNARRIINRLDRAEQIGRYARIFWYAIRQADGQPSPKSLPGQAGSDLDAEWQELVREFA